MKFNIKNYNNIILYSCCFKVENMKKERFYPLLALVVIFMVSFTLMVSIHTSWSESMNKYLPLDREVKSLKSDLSEAHLWLEEVISGDPYIDIEEDILVPLNHKTFHAYLSVAEEIFLNKEDEHYLKHIYLIDEKVERFKTIALKRLEHHSTHSIGSDLDQKFDKEFIEIIDLINSVSLEINEQISREIEQRNYDFSIVISIFLFINILLFVVLFRSVMRQYEYEKSLKEEKERALVTIESIGDAVITTDVEGNVTYFNRIARKLTELSNKDVIGKPIDKILNVSNAKTGERKSTPIHDVIHNGVTKFISNGTKLTSASGKVYIISDSAAPVKDENGNVFGTVLVFQDDTSRHEMQSKLEYRANYDSLTKLPNRSLFLDRLEQGIKVAKRSESKMALLFVDLDHFKEINDSLGHGVGDLVLKQVSIRLAQEIRATDTISRIGGDEFTIILNAIDIELLVGIVTKLFVAMEAPFDILKHRMHVTISIGITICPDDSSNVDVLLKNADSAMYKAKFDGRNTYQFYTKEMTKKSI